MPNAQLSQMFAGLTFSDWLAGASAVLAVISFVISQGAARRQERMAAEGLRLARDSDLIAWADRAIDAISDAQRHCRDLKNALLVDAEAARNQSELRTRLSALLDRGRLFFPNDPAAPDEDGDGPEAAYTGTPQPSIDALYQVYRIISDLGRSSLAPAQAVTAVVAARRRFVSEVFLSVDPRRREAALRGFLGRP